MTVASTTQTYLKQLIVEIQGQAPPTLASWRLNFPPILQALEVFATSSDDSNDLLLEQTQQLFDRLNPLLRQQEQGHRHFCASSASSSSNSNCCSVVFGGKWSASPQSISEILIAKLSGSVVTVSRSNLSYELPNHVTHVAKHHLDDDRVGGVKEFLDVMVFAKAKCSPSSTFVFYLTLGQHKGTNPFMRNLNAAQNFSQALLQNSHQLLNKNWRVVLTGTDAALPSTHPDSQLDDNQVIYNIPSYKIMKYNYVYAMSKLGQYYIVANAIAKILGKQDLVEQIQPVIAKIQRHVQEAGENGDEEASSIIGRNELDQISKQIIHIETKLQDHFWIAKGISICYTPLHAKPWTDQAIDKEDPKAYVLEQIVRRFKNAISIEQGASCHFPTHS